jgi:hypothetical protein
MFSTSFPSALRKTEKKGKPSNFHDFWNEVLSKKHPKKITLNFEHYNLLDAME